MFLKSQINNGRLTLTFDLESFKKQYDKIDLASISTVFVVIENKKLNIKKACYLIAPSFTNTVITKRQKGFWEVFHIVLVFKDSSTFPISLKTKQVFEL